MCVRMGGVSVRCASVRCVGVGMGVGEVCGGGRRRCRSAGVRCIRGGCTRGDGSKRVRTRPRLVRVRRVCRCAEQPVSLCRVPGRAARRAAPCPSTPQAAGRARPRIASPRPRRRSRPKPGAEQPCRMPRPHVRGRVAVAGPISSASALASDNDSAVSVAAAASNDDSGSAVAVAAAVTSDYDSDSAVASVSDYDSCYDYDPGYDYDSRYNAAVALAVASDAAVAPPGRRAGRGPRGTGVGAAATGRAPGGDRGPACGARGAAPPPRQARIARAAHWPARDGACVRPQSAPHATHRPAAATKGRRDASPPFENETA